MPKFAPSSDNLLLGKGEVLFARRAGGVLGPFLHMGNVETFELTTNDDVLDKYESMTRAAALYKRVTRRRDVVLRVTADEFTPANIAMALMGVEASATAQEDDPVVDEVLTESAMLGAYYKTALMGPITSVSLATGATPLVLGVDYVIHDPEIGVVRLLEGSTVIENGDPLSISYTPTAYAGGLDVIRGGTETLIEGSVMFLPDPTTGPRYMVEVWNVSVAPDGAIGLISNEFAQMALQMAVQADTLNHPNEPLYRFTRLPDAT